MAVIYKKPDLLYLITQAVNESGWNILYLNSEHPFKFKIYKDEESYYVKAIIYNITHGGGRARADNEYRIQVKEREFAPELPYKTLILGYYDELKVFAGWDLMRHLGRPGYSASFQIRAENLQTASVTGFSPCDKGNNEIAIAFRPDFFAEYVRSLESLHAFGEAPQDFEILSAVTNNEIIPNEDMVQAVTAPRQKTLQLVSRTQRDNSFRNRVLRTYGYRCAFSGVQLRLIDAAHIVPVNVDGSTDETSNGIALSAIHHKAYDKGLITFNERYEIIHKDSELRNLQQLDLHGGIEAFLAGLRHFIDVPVERRDRPNVAYVTTANSLRGWPIVPA
jgi:putative restriction endonuclease